MAKISDGGDGFQGRTPKPTKAQMEARNERQKALDEKQSRKDDTRRKILIGAVVLEHGSDEMLASIIDIIKSHKSPHNAKLFNGWSRSPKKQ